MFFSEKNFSHVFFFSSFKINLQKKVNLTVKKVNFILKIYATFKNKSLNFVLTFFVSAKIILGKNYSQKKSKSNLWKSKFLIQKGLFLFFFRISNF